METKIALITLCETPFARALARRLLNNHIRVYALTASDAPGVRLLPGNPADAAKALKDENAELDLYIETANERLPEDNFDIDSGVRADVILKAFDENTLSPMARLEAFLLSFRECGPRRLCFLSSAQATVSGCTQKRGYGYAMSKGALHNFLRMALNRLMPLRYTMRLYDPMTEQLCAEASAAAAVDYFLRDRAIDHKLPWRDDEKRLRVRDATGREHAW